VLTTLAAAAIIGIAKGGFGGVGTVMAVPVMSPGPPPAAASGVLLPILMLADVVSVFSHRHDADRASAPPRCRACWERRAWRRRSASCPG